MTISLRIDNVDALPDGGPLTYRASKRGFEIGREHRDWTLPDPNMFISGRHCEIRYEKGGYWLYDVSRNGTFLNGASQRVRSPHELMPPQKRGQRSADFAERHLDLPPVISDNPFEDPEKPPERSPARQPD